jgi:hypothetical protein
VVVVDSFKDMNFGRVDKGGVIIIINEDGKVLHIHNFTFIMENNKFSFGGIDCHFIASKPVGHFFKLSVDSWDKVRQ